MDYVPATIQGTGGYCVLGGFDVKFNQWVATPTFDRIRTTGFGSNGFHDGEITNCELSGSANGIAWIDSSSIPAGIFNVTDNGGIDITGSFNATKVRTRIELQGKANGSWNYTFAADVTRINYTRNETGAFEVSFDFVSSGPICVTQPLTA